MAVAWLFSQGSVLYTPTTNTRPIAVISSPTTASVGSTITLQAGYFDTDLDETYTYKWRVITGSTRVTLQSNDEQSVDLTLKSQGTASIGLIVSDGTIDSLEVVQNITIAVTTAGTSFSNIQVEGIPDGIYITTFHYLSTGALIQKKFLTFQNENATTTLPVVVGTEYDVSIKNSPLTHYTGREGVTF